MVVDSAPRYPSSAIPPHWLLPGLPLLTKRLISRIAGRDEVAFAEIYDRFAPRLLGLAGAVLKDRVEAEDVLQESFLFLWNKAGQFEPSRGPAFIWMALIGVYPKDWG
jgi:DNA-directed RNA polymerase specialized sigma24 family protein